MSDSFDCQNCRHDFPRLHLETDRVRAVRDEAEERRCNDCVACLDPDDAPIRERGRELVDA